MFVVNFIFLGWIGRCPASDPFIGVGQVRTLFFFVLIFLD
jgi:quinol-cytochrome oxidoreductase complex cytochrome b subunit